MRIPANRRILLIDDVPRWLSEAALADRPAPVVICTAYAREMPAPMGHVGERSQPEGAMADRRI
jgi:hypothetical protein